jgi:hypothetical protein
MTSYAGYNECGAIGSILIINPKKPHTAHHHESATRTQVLYPTEV